MCCFFFHWLLNSSVQSVHSLDQIKELLVFSLSKACPSAQCEVVYASLTRLLTSLLLARDRNPALPQCLEEFRGELEQTLSDCVLETAEHKVCISHLWHWWPLPIIKITNDVDLYNFILKGKVTKTGHNNWCLQRSACTCMYVFVAILQLIMFCFFSTASCWSLGEFAVNISLSLWGKEG